MLVTVLSIQVPERNQLLFIRYRVEHRVTSSEKSAAKFRNFHSSMKFI